MMFVLTIYPTSCCLLVTHLSHKPLSPPLKSTTAVTPTQARYDELASCGDVRGCCAAMEALTEMKELLEGDAVDDSEGG